MLSSVFSKDCEYRRIERALNDDLVPMGIIGLSNIHKAHYMASLCLSLGKTAVILCDTESNASKIVDDLNFFAGGACLYPRREYNFNTTATPSREYQYARLNALLRLSDGSCRFVVSTLEAASQLTVPPKELKRRSVSISVGDELSPQSLAELLLKAGYHRADTVEVPGQFALRGEILDFFGPDSADPVRLEFWGDEINLISSFNAETQRRNEPMDKARIVPAAEIITDSSDLIDRLQDFLIKIKRRNAAEAKAKIASDIEMLQGGIDLNCCDKYLSLIFDEPATLFDYIEPNSLLFAAESRAIRLNFEQWARDQLAELKQHKADGDLTAGLDRYFIDFKSAADYYEALGVIFIDNFERGRYDTPYIKSLHRVADAKTNAAWNGAVSALGEDLAAAKDKHEAVCIVAGTEKNAKNVAADLCAFGTEAVFMPKLPSEFSKKTVTVVPGYLSSGFEYEDSLFMLISYRRNAATSARRNTPRKGRKDKPGFTLEEIKPGDYVVHETYGIGVFLGITTKTVDGKKADYLQIQYSDGELFVPVDKISMLTKYMGAENADSEVKLNSFSSTKAWERTKAKARENAEQTARQLADVYSRRLSEIGYAFSPDDDLQNLFELKFEFEETEDQIRAISDVKRDMQSVHPMDRLLLGDVGYGKTEVALRGAFKCVEEGKQCAVLVPTTILALQHFQTILKRFDGFAVNVEMLSRFRTAKEKNEIKQKLKKGLIDIVVGTHGLLSDGVEFRDLGLLIVDEEQRFGVKQKEKIKAKFPLVDVLTISATPIPRTLNMAMSGIRDMSLLEIPPQDRHAVQTIVMEHDLRILSKAIEREINRGGQVYYLYNRIDDIEKRADEIRRYLPSARVGVGHGQMSEEQLSEVWRSLLDGEIDVLVCTTIIETGVDVPNANTLIVENANRLGLAQLHQIRGRVGRSPRRAYAYFTYKPERAMSDTAHSRLEAIEQYTGFGAGYHIAMRDLQIRGAGEILGTKQHGHMAAVGYDLYIRMLNEAVEELGTVERVAKRPPCRINVSMDMSIPDTYITSYAGRIEIYKRILAIESTADAQDVLDEIIDRYGNEMRGGKDTGSMPKCVADLVKYAELKARATAQCINEISQKGRFVAVYADKISIKHATMLKNLYGDRPIVKMEGLRQCMMVPLRGAHQALMVIERIIKAFETVEV